MIKKHYILQAINSEGKSVYIDDVQNGKKCGCICKECGGALVAKQGNINVHHFAHATGTDCIKCSQTAMHLLAKEIISEEKNIPVLRNGKIEFAKVFVVEQEKKLGDIVPDLYAEIDGKAIAIEIFVSHAIDAEKFRKIQKHRLTTFEINLSQETVETKEELKRKIYDLKNIRLIYDEKFITELIERKKIFLLRNGVFKPINNGIVQKCRMCGTSNGRFIKWNNVKAEFCKTCFLGYYLDTGVYCIGELNGSEKIPVWFLKTNINENMYMFNVDISEILKIFKRLIHNAVV